MSDIETFEDLLVEAHGLAHEVYLPAGVLIWWSSPNKLLNSKRPCDITRERDVDGMLQVNQVLGMLVDGNFA